MLLYRAIHKFGALISCLISQRKSSIHKCVNYLLCRLKYTRHIYMHNSAMNAETDIAISLFARIISMELYYFYTIQLMRWHCFVTIYKNIKKNRKKFKHLYGVLTFRLSVFIRSKIIEKSFGKQFLSKYNLLYAEIELQAMH